MKERGFTLVELTVVLAVLAILAGIAMPSMMGYRNRAAHGVNLANLLTIRRQIEAVYQAFPGDFAEVDVHTEYTAEFLLERVLDDVEVPVALEVSGSFGVTEGTPMKAMLEMPAMPEGMNDVWEELDLHPGQVGTYWNSLGGGEEEMPEETEPTERPPAPDVPSETLPGGEDSSGTEEPTEPVPTEPVVPEHACRDRDGNCVCDIEGCGVVMHEEAAFVENGNCKKCGMHYIHRGLEDKICNTCHLNIETGEIHVCSWEEGVCRCVCGASRCDHGSSGMGKCAICGNYNVLMEPCENCKRKQ